MHAGPVHKEGKIRPLCFSRLSAVYQKLHLLLAVLLSSAVAGVGGVLSSRHHQRNTMRPPRMMVLDRKGKRGCVAAARKVANTSCLSDVEPRGPTWNQKPRNRLALHGGDWYDVARPRHRPVVPPPCAFGLDIAPSASPASVNPRLLTNTVRPRASEAATALQRRHLISHVEPVLEIPSR